MEYHKEFILGTSESRILEFFEQVEVSLHELSKSPRMIISAVFVLNGRLWRVIFGAIKRALRADIKRVVVVKLAELTVRHGGEKSLEHKNLGTKRHFHNGTTNGNQHSEWTS